MKKHFSPILHTEPVLTLSIEEAAILDDELGECATQMASGVDAIGRLGDIVVCVADVQVIISNTPEISTAENGLINAVNEMAVAGTDASPDDILPTTLEDETLSAEGFIDATKNFLSRMWEMIKNAIAKMWEHVKKFFARLGLGVDHSIKKAEHVLQSVKEHAKDPAPTGVKDHFTYHGQIENLMLGGKVSPDIGHQLIQLQQGFDSVNSKTAKTLKDITEVIEHAVTTLAARDQRYTFQTFAEAFLELVDELGRNLGKKNDKGTYTSPTYLGEISLELEVHLQFSNKDAPLRERYLHACAARVLTIQSDDVNAGMEVPVIPHAASMDLAANSLKWLESIKAAGYYREMNSLQEKIDSLLDKVDTLLAEYKQNPPGSANPTPIESVNFLNDLMRVMPFVDKIKTKVAADVLLRVLKINNEVLAYADQSNKILAANDPT